MAPELMVDGPEMQGQWELLAGKRGFEREAKAFKKQKPVEEEMANEKKNRRAPNLVDGAPAYTAQLEDILRRPNYAGFIEEIQQKLQSDPQYLHNHRDEAFRQALVALERGGDLKNMQPSEKDVETALMAIVGIKNR